MLVLSGSNFLDTKILNLLGCLTNFDFDSILYFHIRFSLVLLIQIFLPIHSIKLKLYMWTLSPYYHIKSKNNIQLTLITSKYEIYRYFLTGYVILRYTCSLNIFKILSHSITKKNKNQKCNQNHSY